MDYSTDKLEGTKDSPKVLRPSRAQSLTSLPSSSKPLQADPFADLRRKLIEGRADHKTSLPGIATPPLSYSTPNLLKTLPTSLPSIAETDSNPLPTVRVVTVSADTLPNDLQARNDSSSDSDKEQDSSAKEQDSSNKEQDSSDKEHDSSESDPKTPFTPTPTMWTLLLYFLGLIGLLSFFEALSVLILPSMLTLLLSAGVMTLLYFYSDLRSKLAITRTWGASSRMRTLIKGLILILSALQMPVQSLTTALPAAVAPDHCSVFITNSVGELAPSSATSCWSEETKFARQIARAWAEEYKKSGLTPEEWADGWIASTPKHRAYTVAANNSLYIPWGAGTGHYSALIDNGANINLINERILSKLVSILPPDQLQISNDTLTASVANGARWVLRTKATITFHVDQHLYIDEFWVTPNLKEDVLLGMPALRTMYSTLFIAGEGDTEPDHLYLRNARKRINCHYLPHGVSHSPIPLYAVNQVTLPRHTSTVLRLQPKTKTGFYWPKDTPLQGTAEPALRNGSFKALPMHNVSVCASEGRVSVPMNNLSDKDQTYLPGDIVAYLEPEIQVRHVTATGDYLLGMGLDGSIGTISSSWRPGDNKPPPQQLTTITEASLPPGVLHVGYLCEDEGDNEITYTIQPFTRQEAALHKLRNVSAPATKKPPAYSYRDVHIEPRLDAKNAELLVQWRHRFKDLFAPIQHSFPNPNLPDWTKLEIKLMPGAPRWKSRSYPMSQEKKQALDDLLQAQMERGMIQHSCSPYALPTFLVPKPGKKWRRVVDARQLNKWIQPSAWPLPRIYEILDKLKGCKFFSAFDLAEGFRQIGLTTESTKYTAFICDTGLYEETTVPMGLTTAPNHFQYVMSRILSGTALPEKQPNLLGTHVFCYIDDLLIASPTIEEHLTSLTKVAERLLQFGLRAKAPKCKLGMLELKYLGSIIDEQGRRPCPEKIEAIRNMPIPTGRKAKAKLQTFLGMCNWLAEYVDHYQQIVGPLISLTTDRANTEADWTSEHTNAFNACKEALTSAPVLAHPDFDLPFEIAADASKTHIGGVLQQRHSGKLVVIEYFSRRLTAPQRKWHMTHLECLAVRECLYKWERYLKGRDGTTVFTDHQALIWLRVNKYSDRSGKLVRWFTYIDSFPNLQLEHRPGHLNPVADALTRMYEDETDIVWDPQNTHYDWIYNILFDNLPPKVTHICEVTFGGPTGQATASARNLPYRAVSHDRFDGKTDESTLVVAVPQPRRTDWGPFLRKVKRYTPTWSLWAAPTIMCSSWFREPDIQLLVPQGKLGYGANSRGEPVRCLWITHNLLPSTILLPLGPQPKVTLDLLAKTRSIYDDWETWSQTPSDSTPESDLLETVADETYFTSHFHDNPFPRSSVRAVTAFSSPSNEWSHTCEKIALREMARTRFPQQLTPYVNVVADDQGGAEESGRFHVPEIVKDAIAEASRDWREAQRLEPAFAQSQQDKQTLTDSNTALTADRAADPSLIPQRAANEQVVKGFQDRDPFTQDILTQLRTSPTTTLEKSVKGGQRLTYFEKEDLLYVMDKQSRARLYVPRPLRQHLLHTFHRSKIFLHPGQRKMYDSIRQEYYWPGLKKDVQTYVAECLACSRTKPGKPMQQGDTFRVVPEHPFQIVGIDIKGPLPLTIGENNNSSDTGYRYIITIVDHYSRWVQLTPIKGPVTAKAIADVFVREWVKRNGIPTLLVSDSGTQFKSQFMEELTILLGIRLHRAPVEAQFRNGKVERVHRFLGRRMKLWKTKQLHTWHRQLPYIEMAHHFLPMMDVQMSPFEILYGKKPTLPFTAGSSLASIGHGDARSFIKDMHKKLYDIQKTFHTLDVTAAFKALQRRKAAEQPLTLQPGDSALVFTQGTKDKQTVVWSDLVTVVAHPNQTTYTVRYPNHETADVPAQRLQRAPKKRAEHATMVGPFLTQHPFLQTRDAPVPVTELASNRPMRDVTLPDSAPQVGTPVGKNMTGAYLRHKLCLTDYIAHKHDNNSWTISQYLGYDDEAPPHHLCLRRMDHYPVTDPRKARWGYLWNKPINQAGRPVIGLNKKHDEPPNDRDRATLEMVYENIPESDLISIVSLTKNLTIHSTCWNDLMQRGIQAGIPKEQFISSTFTPAVNAVSSTMSYGERDGKYAPVYDRHLTYDAFGDSNRNKALWTPARESFLYPMPKGEQLYNGNPQASYDQWLTISRHLKLGFQDESRHRTRAFYELPCQFTTITERKAKSMFRQTDSKNDAYVFDKPDKLVRNIGCYACEILTFQYPPIKNDPFQPIRIEKRHETYELETICTLHIPYRYWDTENQEHGTPREDILADSVKSKMHNQNPYYEHIATLPVLGPYNLLDPYAHAEPKYGGYLSEMHPAPAFTWWGWQPSTNSSTWAHCRWPELKIACTVIMRTGFDIDSKTFLTELYQTDGFRDTFIGLHQKYHASMAIDSVTLGYMALALVIKRTDQRKEVPHRHVPQKKVPQQRTSNSYDNNKRALKSKFQSSNWQNDPYRTYKAKNNYKELQIAHFHQRTGKDKTPRNFTTTRRKDRPLDRQKATPFEHERRSETERSAWPRNSKSVHNRQDRQRPKAVEKHTSRQSSSSSRRPYSNTTMSSASSSSSRRPYSNTTMSSSSSSSSRRPYSNATMPNSSGASSHPYHAEKSLTRPVPANSQQAAFAKPIPRSSSLTNYSANDSPTTGTSSLSVQVQPGQDDRKVQRTKPPEPRKLTRAQQKRTKRKSAKSGALQDLSSAGDTGAESSDNAHKRSRPNPSLQITTLTDIIAAQQLMQKQFQEQLQQQNQRHQQQISMLQTSLDTLTRLYQHVTQIEPVVEQDMAISSEEKEQTLQTCPAEPAPENTDTKVTEDPEDLLPTTPTEPSLSDNSPENSDLSIDSQEGYQDDSDLSETLHHNERY